MAEYIDKEALRDALYDADAITMNGVKILNQFPAADVEPVRHGRWEKRGQEIYCSECGEESGYTWAGVSRYSDYCPNCGAKMDWE